MGHASSPLRSGLRSRCVLPRPGEVGPHAQASPYWTPLPLGLVDILTATAPSLHQLGLCLRLAGLILADTTGEPVSVSGRRLVAALGCSRQTAQRVRRLVEAATSEPPYGWEWTDPGRTGAGRTVLPASWTPADGHGAGEPWVKAPTDCHLPARLIAAMALTARTDRGRSRRSWRNIYDRSGARMVCSLRAWHDTVREARRLGLVGRTRGYVRLRWSRLPACPRLGGVAPDQRTSRARQFPSPIEEPVPPLQALTGTRQDAPGRVLVSPKHVCLTSGPPTLYPRRLKGRRGAGEIGAWAEACPDCLPPSGSEAWIEPDHSDTAGWRVVVGEAVWWGREGALIRLWPEPPGLVEGRRLKAATREAPTRDPEPKSYLPGIMATAKEQVRQWVEGQIAAGHPLPAAADIGSMFWSLVRSDQVAASEASGLVSIGATIPFREPHCPHKQARRLP